MVFISKEKLHVIYNMHMHIIYLAENYQNLKMTAIGRNM